MNDKIVSAYYNYMVDIAQILGADKESATQELKESLEFEIKLANVSTIFIKIIIAIRFFNLRVTNYQWKGKSQFI